MTKLRWGILSTGNIAKTFAKALPRAERGELVAVASRSKDKADKFAAEFGGTAYGSYEAMLGSGDVDAVYVATPHPQHAEWAIRCCRAGKHVLCEKPIGVNHAEAMAIFDAADEHGVFVMEAYMWRCHPLAARLAELVKNREIGEVQAVEATFAFRAGGDTPDYDGGRLFSADYAGGGILDVGGYATSAAKLVAAAAAGRENVDALKVSGHGSVADNGIDEVAAGTILFPGGLVASVMTGVRVNAGQRLVVHGTDGRIEVPGPFIPAKEGGRATINVVKNGGTNEITIDSDKPLYAHEADAFAEGVEKGRAPWPAMSREETLSNMKVLDAWRSAVGVEYPFEKRSGFPKTTYAGDALSVRENRIPRVEVGGKQTARLVMGVDNQPTLPHAAAMFDAYFERGGNTFDTAHVYGQLRSKLLGQWIDLRGVRDEVNVICKTAHHPQNFPKNVRPELERCLDWLGTDRCEFHFFHRDNEDVPVGEWVDAANECYDAGLITGAFGGSNWSAARCRAFNDYAEQHGRRPMGAVSMNLSLAEMVEPVWHNAQSAHTPEWLSFLEETRTPNFSWSSQARGFFVPDRDLDEEELKRCWVSDANLERRRRCFDLAGRKGVSPINVAAAWVLKQPFPSIALIGPRTLSELRSSLPALDVELTDREHAWLDLRAETPAG